MSHMTTFVWTSPVIYVFFFPLNAMKSKFFLVSDVCGNWIEIAYGTSSGTVRVIVQHPETVGHGPQLFQTFTVHRYPVTKVIFNLLLIFIPSRIMERE